MKAIKLTKRVIIIGILLTMCACGGILSVFSPKTTTPTATQNNIQPAALVVTDTPAPLATKPPVAQPTATDKPAAQVPVAVPPTRKPAAPAATATVRAVPTTIVVVAPTTAAALDWKKAGLRYDPFGPDRNCKDFKTQKEAQAFFLAAGPGDPHHLDGNPKNGIACESLP